MQSAIGYPLTLHGTGGQTRAFIHLQDTCRCIEKAIMRAPARGSRPRIMNQMAETRRLRDLADIVAHMTGCEIANVPNPRNEREENDLVVHNDALRGLGWESIYLDQALMVEVLDVTRKYAHRCDRTKIPCTSYWTWERARAQSEQDALSDTHSRDLTRAAGNAHRRAWGLMQ